MANLDYRALAVLDAVAASGSFDKAALALGMTQSAVSQRIKALEDSAGRLLVVRGTPSVPTGLGQRLVAHFRHVQLMEAALDIDLGRGDSLPALRLAVDADSQASWFVQALPALLTPPRCQLDVQLAAGADALTLVREGAAFACVADDSAGPVEAAHGTSATALGVQRYLCVATPAFAGHWFGDGFSAEAAALAPGLSNARGLLARFLAAELGVQTACPQHLFDAPGALQSCLLSGAGYGLLPELLALAPLAAGQLVELRPGAGLDVALSWHAWNIDTPFTRTLSEHVSATARRFLRQP
jgi:LysR family transcriptional regulator (chromosome initiation inhibitor)